ncbi:MAG: beta-ketoacyl synthase N-terminal-like domain-containing protein, partial [Candidatus Rokuibacteriota bacterium]
MTARVVITGVGVVHGSVVGGTPALAAALGAPLPSDRRHVGELPGGLIDEAEARRLSRVCQLAVAAGRLAIGDAGLERGAELGLVLGTEFGDFSSTRAFADGFLTTGPAGLSALLFPNTVMNTMAAATTIALSARALSLTLNARSVAGELAVARAAAVIAAGRAPALVAGGVDHVDPLVAKTLPELDEDAVEGEGAAFLVLESGAEARARGARVLGEIVGVASRALAARPHGVGRATVARAIPAALAAAGLRADAIACVYDSASGDAIRDAWQARLLDGALAPSAPPRASLR